jgi:hypothetical protein
MNTPSHLAKYAIFLGLGIAIGAGTVNLIGQQDTAAPSTGKTANAKAAPPASDTPKPAVATFGASDWPAEGEGAPALYEDVTLTEPAESGPVEVATAEPPPEELMKTPPPPRPATDRISFKETEAVEAKLRQESENAPPNQSDNEGLPEHEKP